MASKAVTVTGPIDPSDLGITLVHEHLFIDLRNAHLPGHDVTPTEQAMCDAKVDLSNLSLAREGYPIADNYVLEDESISIEEVMQFKKLGGGTIVDVTSIGLRRDPLAARRVSESTGLNIIVGSSWYTKDFYTQEMDRRTVEDLSDEIIRDITDGIGDTGIRAGIIGEVGINGNPLTPNEVKVIRASARASRLTGAAISFHRGGVGEEKHRVLDIVAQEGAELTRTILGHSDDIADDLPLILELLKRGVYIEFDMMASFDTPFVLSRIAKVSQAIPKLIEAGYGNRILISQDVCWKVHLKRYAGRGYTFILEKFLTHLRCLGVADEQINELLVENPKRVLAFQQSYST